MPFVDIKLSVALPASEKEAIGADLRQACQTILNKPANYVMIGFQESLDMQFQGSKEPCAYVQINMLGACSSDAASRMTETVCNIFSRNTTIPTSRIFVSYYHTAHWGLDGHNF